MALKITYTDPESKLVITDSYHKVTGMLDSRIEKRMQIHVSLYKDADEKANGNYIRFKGSQFAKINCSGDDYDTYFGITALNANNPIEQAYTFLKTQDPTIEDYKGDCAFNYKKDSTDI